MNNENTWTQGGEHHTPDLLGGTREGKAGVRELGRDNMKRYADIGDGVGGSKPHCHVCTYATILHVLHMYPKT